MGFRKRLCAHSLCACALLFSLSAWAEDRWVAEAYAENSSIQYVCSAEVINTYRFRGNEKILHIGSTDGALSALLARNVPDGSVLSIDLSPSMVDYAKRRWVGEKNLSFLLMDGLEISFKREFDLVTFFFTTEWIADQRRLMQNVEASLVPGGRLLIVSPSRLPIELEAAFHEVIERPLWAPFFENFTSPLTFPTFQELSKILTDVNFAIIKFEARKKNIVLSSREVFQKMIAVSFPYVDNLPKHLKESFLNELINAYIVIYPLDRFQRILCKLETFEVWATKNH